MVLVDTSVWIEHLRTGHRGLEVLLMEGHVVCHRLIIGELACGFIKNRKEILSLLSALPIATEAEHDEVMSFIDRYRLMGKGLGFIDVHLMASSVLSGTTLWTLDKILKRECARLRIVY